MSEDKVAGIGDYEGAAAGWGALKAAMDSGNAASCAQRYRFDAASGTFLGHDGRRRSCS